MKMKKNILKINCCFLSLLMIFFTTSINSYATTKSKITLPKTSLPNSITILTKDIESNEISTSKHSTMMTLSRNNRISMEGYNPSLISTTAIIGGSDEREIVTDTTVYPYSCIAYIESYWPSGETTIGTATLIDPNDALTAAHCLYDPENGGWAKSVTIWPGKHGFSVLNNPFGTAKSTKLTVAESWTQSPNRTNDWGVIQLDSEIGNKCGWLGVNAYNGKEALLYKDVTISGYPKDHRYYQYKMSGKIYGCEDSLVAYYIDAVKGQSGSPVYEKYDNGNCYIVAIHTGEMDDKSYNIGTRISASVIYAIMDLIK